MKDNRQQRRTAARLAARGARGPQTPDATALDVMAAASSVPGTAYGTVEIDGAVWTFLNAGSYVIAAPALAVPAGVARVGAQLESYLRHDFTQPFAATPAFSGRAELLHDVADDAREAEAADGAGRRALLWVGVKPFLWEHVADVALRLLADDDVVEIGTVSGVDRRPRLLVKSARFRMLLGPVKTRGDEPPVALRSAEEIERNRAADDTGSNAPGGDA